MGDQMWRRNKNAGVRERYHPSLQDEDTDPEDGLSSVCMWTRTAGPSKPETAVQREPPPVSNCVALTDSLIWVTGGYVSMSRSVPSGWLKTGRREYESRTVEVEVKFQPTADQDGMFEVWVVDEETEESTAVDNVQPSETDARELAKDVMTSFTEAYDDAGEGDEAVDRAIELAVEANGS
jgi:hypothetical protein